MRAVFRLLEIIGQTEHIAGFGKTGERYRFADRSACGISGSVYEVANLESAWGLK
ncbi:MAG TPA: hypothetical protein PKC13_22245 [Blastocatellia bacterium]|nr:hypothetical protein [Blastocatellia bacterium]